MAKINTVFSLTDHVSSPLNTIRQNVFSTVHGFESMSGKLVTLNAGLDLLRSAMGVIQSVGSVFGKTISDAGEYESLLASLTTATGDAIEAQKEFDKLKEFAKTTPFDMPGVVQASVMFRNAGVEAKNVIPMISMLGDVAQGNNDYFQRMSVNLMQIMSSGKATMMDINQFALMGVPIKQVLADMGVTGQATANDVIKAFQIMTSEGGQFYQSMMNSANTFSGQMSNLEDSIQQLSANIGNAFLPVVKTIVSAFGEFISNLNELDRFKSILNGLQKATVAFQNNINNLIAMILYLGTVAVLVGNAMGVAWAVAHWPILLTVTLIGTLIRMFLEVIDGANSASQAMTGFGNQSAKAGEMLGRVIGFIVGVVKGLFNIIYNVIATVYNALQTVIEFIANMFTHPILAIQGLFLNLATSILNVLETIASAVDLVFNTSLQETIAKASQAIQKFKKENIVKDGYVTGFGGEAGLLGLKDVQGALDVSSNFGNTFKDIFSLIDKNFTFGNLENELIAPPDIGNNLKFDSSGALVVSDKNTIDLADDFRELLSKQATERFNLQMSSITPNVQFGDFIINNNADLEAILDEFTSKVEDVSHSTLRS